MMAGVSEPTDHLYLVLSRIWARGMLLAPFYGVVVSTQAVAVLRVKIVLLMTWDSSDHDVSEL